MRIGAYQFRVTGNIDENRKIILKAISEAVSQKLDLLVFPECALTGYIYFLNTQKLGTDKLLTSTGDAHSHTIWETITNTVNRQPKKFYVVIDDERVIIRTKLEKSSKIKGLALI